MNPITKIIPKVMLPIVNVPNIEYLINEGLKSCINDFIIIVNEDYRIIKEYLQYRYSDINVQYVVQNNLNGLGGALLLCKELLNQEDFGLMLGDEFLYSDNKCYGISRLIDIYNETNQNILGLTKVLKKDIDKYGIVNLKNTQIVNIIEKPTFNIKSRLAISGRYVLKYEVFDYLEKITCKDIGLSDGLKLMIKDNELYGCIIQDKRFDIGSLNGFINANNYMKKRI